jgi:cell division protein FtsI (penicillin-binding protein 3)
MRVLELSIPNRYEKVTDEKKSINNKNNERGLLIDRNGNIVASNIYIYNLKAYPRNINKPEKIIKLLKEHVNFTDFNVVKRKIFNKSKCEVVIKKNITAPEAKRINSLGIPGLEFVPVIKRFYPNEKITAHYLGHVNKEMKGVYGAERSFNDTLNKGEDVKLSIDIRVQYAVRDELIKASKKFNSKSATAIIADINNGEIISLVSLPDYNPNTSIDPKRNSYRNTATLNLYEMGSTFKIFSIAAALERSDISINSKYDARKPMRLSKYTIKDYHPQNRILSIKEIFLKSSNIGASRIALELETRN